MRREVSQAMRMLVNVAFVVGGMATASFAQAAPEPTWYVGVGGGASAVQNVGAAAVAEVGMHLSPSTDVFVDGIWLQDVVTRRRIGTATSLGDYLGQQQHTTATVTIEAPASIAAGGVRWNFGRGRTRPYVTASGGVARITLQPTILVAGNDVTKTISNFGVALGEDLTGSTTHPVVGGGVGFVMTRGRLAIDVGLRVFSIRTPEQATNAKTIAAGIGYGF